MNRPERTTAYDINGLFRVEHQEVPHKTKPYEFVKRMGAVTMLPISLEASEPSAIIVHNKRHHYGSSVNMPAGNIAGDIDNQDSAAETALRELREETGYGYADGAEPSMSLFALREYSNTIDYPRFFAVMHGVSYLGGEVYSSHEIVTPQPMSLKEYVDPFFTLDRGETYPELNAAFARAGMLVGHEAVYTWLVNPSPENAAPIHETFAPWLIHAPEA